MTRLKNTLAEDLIAAKKDIERLSEHNLRLNKEKEGLTKERGNLVVDLNGTERDNQTLNSVKNSNLFDLFSLFFYFRQSVHYGLSMWKIFHFYMHCLFFF
jgi:hypothetical protein